MPALALSIQRHRRFAGLPARATLRRWIAATLERDAQLTLRFVDAREARRLNRDFRGKDYAADVLTFGYSTQPMIDADIVICVSVSRAQARQRGKPLADHLAHLIVHAILHAHGHRHDQAAAAQAMERREIEVLQVLGQPDPYG